MQVPTPSWQRPPTQAPQSQSASVVQERRTQPRVSAPSAPGVQVALGGHATPSVQFGGRQRPVPLSHVWPSGQPPTVLRQSGTQNMLGPSQLQATSTVWQTWPGAQSAEATQSWVPMKQAPQQGGGVSPGARQ
jgi:hypothetical protein